VPKKSKDLQRENAQLRRPRYKLLNFGLPFR
jgi:hypothetical protein